MSFISFSFEGISLTDSEIGEVDFNHDEIFWLEYIRIYSERNLPVGRNLALATIWYSNVVKYSVAKIVEVQDMHCVDHPNWKQYAKERDEYLVKLLPLL